MFPAYFNGRRFRPQLVPTVVTLLLLVLLPGLGWWQLQRADESRALRQALSDSVEAPVVELTALDPAAAENRYRRVEVSGHYEPTRRILLDNQLVGGRSGVHVYTPLWWGEPERLILVNEGWVAWGASRARLPELEIPETAVTLRGRLDQPANPGIRLGDPLDREGWPKLVQHIDYRALGEVLGQPLLPAVILLDPEHPAGYLRDWRVSQEVMSPARHVGYAFQWFAMAATLLVLFIVLSFRPVTER